MNLHVVPHVDPEPINEDTLTRRGNKALTDLRDAHQDMLAHIGLPYIWAHDDLSPHMSRDLIRQARDLGAAADSIREAAIRLEAVIDDAEMGRRRK